MRLILTSTITALVIAVGLVPWHGAVADDNIKAGEVVYDNHCFECHDTGRKGAPKLGDKDAWADRIKQSELLLTDHVYYGHRKMPNLGNCNTCTKRDIANAVAYIVSKVK